MPPSTRPDARCRVSDSDHSESCSVVGPWFGSVRGAPPASKVLRSVRAGDSHCRPHRGAAHERACVNARAVETEGASVCPCCIHHRKGARARPRARVCSTRVCPVRSHNRASIGVIYRIYYYVARVSVSASGGSSWLLLSHPESRPRPLARSHIHAHTRRNETNVEA